MVVVWISRVSTRSAKSKLKVSFLWCLLDEVGVRVKSSLSLTVIDPFHAGTTVAIQCCQMIPFFLCQLVDTGVDRTEVIPGLVQDGCFHF